MTTRTRALAPLLMAAFAAFPAAAQTDVPGGGTATDSTKAAAAASLAKPIVIQNIRPNDQRGIGVFEAPKEAGVTFEGFKLDLGAAFTQQFQTIDHSNTAAENLSNGVDLNKPVEIGPGFNNASANLYLNGQLAPGIRVALTTYLSSRHHQETWVKDGYLLIDQSPIDHPVLDNLMEYLTLKVGHMEINYGDAHFRRSDNGQAIYNPFVGNYILDAFTTEVGAEAYVRTGPWLAMAGVTGGQIRGDVTNPSKRHPSFLGKVGFDQQLNDLVRIRLTGSAYANAGSPGITLYAGDRAGSRYYSVLENANATTNGNFTSGLLNPGFGRELVAWQINPFVEVGGLELFGVVEKAEGRGATETDEQKREWTQYAADVVYRFLPREQLYVGARYNTVSGTMAAWRDDEVGADRFQVGAGWFITPSVLLKGEYVTQEYSGFPTTDIRSGGKFNGFVFEGVVAF
ncbi:MAG TPA: hypothetical protein VHG91_13575 [Longimicrobium sp.]|nr:hypothetical protein [Longimicrobium sp.]